MRSSMSLLLALLCLTTFLSFAHADFCACDVGAGHFYCFANDCDSTTCSEHCLGCSKLSDWTSMGTTPTSDADCIALCAARQLSGTIAEKAALKLWEGYVDGAKNECGTPTRKANTTSSIEPTATCTSFPTSYSTSPSYDFSNGGSGSPCTDVNSPSFDGNTCDVSCADGFVPSTTTAVSQLRLTCDASTNTWKGNFACERECTLPTAAEFAEANIDFDATMNTCSDAREGKLVFGATCDVKCSSNYQLASLHRLSCSPRGMSSLPNCLPVPNPAPCTTPPQTAGLKVDLAVGTCKSVSATNPLGHGNTCSFGCASGYNRANNMIRCNNGEWESQPDCMSYPTNLVKLFRKLIRDKGADGASFA